MARQTDGISQYLVSASALTLSGSSLLTNAFWLWTDAFVNGTTMSVGTVLQNGIFYFNPKALTGFYMQDFTGGLVVDTEFTPPDAASWHHYVVAMDRSLSGTAQMVGVWVDGAVPSGIAHGFTDDVVSTFLNDVLNLGRYAGATDYQAGRIAEVVLYSGYNFTQTDVNNLYNRGAGRDARTVQTPTYYWPLIGDSGAFVEPGLVGGIDMVVSGATPAAHPISIWGPDVTPGPTRTMFRSRLRVY